MPQNKKGIDQYHKSKPKIKLAIKVVYISCRNSNSYIFEKRLKNIISEKNKFLNVLTNLLYLLFLIICNLQNFCYATFRLNMIFQYLSIAWLE